MLKERLNNDMKEAMKARNAVKRMVLSLVNSAIKNKELEKRSRLVKKDEKLQTGGTYFGPDIEKESELTDEEIIDVISSEVKKRKESVESYEKGGREELAQKERDELNILMEYMPEQIPEDEIRTEVKKAIAETGAKDIKEMGKVIGVVMLHVKGKADGGRVSQIVKEELTE